MAGKKTLEEYQIQEIASAILESRLSEFSKNLVLRGEYDRYTINNDNNVASISKDVTTLQNKEDERQKDKKTLKFQITGIAIGFVFQFIVWAIAISNGFKVGGP